MRRIVIAIASAALMLSACGNAAENLTERIVESESGGDIQISDDSMVFQSEDGDATMTVTGDDEGVSIIGTDESGEDISIQMGGTEVPEGFPMPIFDPSEVSNVSSFEMATGSSYTVTLEIDPGDAADALAFYKDWIEGESMSVTSSNEMVIGEGDDATAIVRVDEYGDYSEVVMTWAPNS